MGFGFPAALGAQAAYPDRPVIAIVGDGGFQMNIQELATAAQYNLPVKTFIVNNSNLGMVRQWQEIFYQKRYSHVDLSCSPDFVKVAEAYGVKGLRATKPSELDDMVTEAMNHNGPVVMECKVAPEENVFPMVGPGCANHNMLLKFEKKDEIPVIPVGAALNS